MEKMNLEKFYKKLKKEAFIKSLICGISASLILNSLIIILFKRIPVKIIVFVHILLFLILSAAFTYLFFKKVFVITDKYLAKRIEKDINLNEQVKTMIEFKDVDSPMVKLQRQKTMETLNKVDSKSLKMKFSLKNFALSILALILLPLSILIESKEIEPNAEENESSPSTSEESPSTNQEQQDSSNMGQSNGGDQGSQGEGDGQENSEMNETIDNMQQEVNENEGLNDDQKEDINQDLEDLKGDLENSENEEEKQDSIDQTQQEVNEKLDDAITKDEIGEALQNQDSTTEVGENVSNGDSEGTNNSLDDLRESLENLTGDELKEALEDIASDIDKALEESGVSEKDPLYDAFKDFSENLKENAANSNASDIQDQIDDTFKQAKEDISNALEDQNAIEDLQGSLNDQFEDLKNQAGGENSSENQEGQEGENQGGEGQEGEGQEGENQEGSGGEGAGVGSGEITYASDDLIYDPNTNSYVTYGELLTYYYSQAVQGMEDGSVPEDLQSLINDYFSSLYYDEENND